MQLPKQHSRYSPIGLPAAKLQHSRHYLIFTKNKIRASKSSMRRSQEVMDRQRFPSCRPDFWVEIHRTHGKPIQDPSCSTGMSRPENANQLPSFMHLKAGGKLFPLNW